MKQLLSNLDPDQLIALRHIIKNMYELPRPSLNKLRDLVYDEIDLRVMHLQTKIEENETV